MTETELQGRRLRSLLDDAVGKSEFVIVVVADIRGFSQFSQSNESPDVAMYIKRVYMRLIDKYFPFGNFFKATGDGLLVTIPFDEKTLQEMARKTIESALACHKDFSQICKGDPMVNVETPERIGIGIARGTACCIVSGDEIVDYSGHLLNLASRLMDFARPSGVVIDGAFGLDLLKPAMAKRFKPEDVYVRSVAEIEPLRVHYLDGAVEISDEAKRPLRLEKWVDWEHNFQLKDWRHPLETEYPFGSQLKRHDGVILRVQFPARRSGKLTGKTQVLDAKDDWNTIATGNKQSLMVNTPAIFAALKKMGVQLNDKLTLIISYVPKP